MGRPKKEKPTHSTGMYVYKATLGYTFDGQRIRKAFYSSKSKLDAKQKAEEYKVAVAVADAQNETIIKDKTHFDTWAIEWLETYKHGTVKEHTYNFTYKSNIEKYLIPYFKHARLVDIKQSDIQKYFNTIRNADNEKPLAKSTLDKQKMILFSIFESAIDNDLCYKNPVKNIKFLHSSAKSERNVYTQEETNTIIEFAKKNSNFDIVILFATGIRRSELLGLKWSDFDFKENVLHIQRAVTQTKSKIIIDSPKTLTSNRIIPFNTEFSEYIQSFIPSLNSNTYVMSNVQNPLSLSTYAKKFKKFMENMNAETGIKMLSPHELRHTYGTLLRESGVDIYTIQRVMGHADISITAGIYVHNDISVLRKQLHIG